MEKIGEMRQHVYNVEKQLEKQGRAIETSIQVEANDHQKQPSEEDRKIKEKQSAVDAMYHEDSDKMQRKSMESEIEVVLHRFMDPLIDPLNRKINNSLQDLKEMVYEENIIRDGKSSEVYKEMNDLKTSLQQVQQELQLARQSSSKSKSAGFKSEQEMSDYIEFYILSVKRKLEKELNNKIENNVKKIESNVGNMLAKSTASVYILLI